MKLLISPKSREEALEAINGGADIVDVKNPAEGSLGANFPWVIDEIREVIPAGIELSATLGDFPYLPGTASLAARGLAGLKVDYVKIGLFGISSIDQGLQMGEAVVKSVKDYSDDIKVVVAGYVDYKKINSINPETVLEIVKKTGADVFMLDTASKNDGNLFRHISVDDLRNLADEAHKEEILVAVGGSVGKEDILTLNDALVDVVGVRGAVCEGNDRMGGVIRREKVRELKDVIERGGVI